MKLLLRMANDFTFFEAPPFFNENGLSLVIDMMALYWLFSNFHFYFIYSKSFYTRLKLNITHAIPVFKLLNLTISY